MGVHRCVIILNAPSDPPSPPQNAALRTVVDLEIFPLLMQAQYQNTGISAAQLSEYTGAEQELIGIASYRIVSLRARLTVSHT